MLTTHPTSSLSAFLASARVLSHGPATESLCHRLVMLLTLGCNTATSAHTHTYAHTHTHTYFA